MRSSGLPYFESRDWGLRALEVARALGDQPLIAAACAVVAMACAFALEIEEAERYRTETAALIDAMPDAQLAIRLDAMAFLTGAELYLDHFEDSIAHGTHGLAVARATGQGELLPILIQALGSALLVRGQLVEAAELFDGSIEAARLSGNEQTLAWSLLNRAFVGVYLGEPDAALPSVQESVDLTRHLDDSLVSTWSNVMMAVVRSQREEHARAVELLVSSAGGPALPLVPGGWRASFLGVLTGSLLALDRGEEATHAVAAAEAVATTTGLGMADGWARRARAALALHAGDATAAVEQALASVAACEAAGAAVEAALSRIIAGRALAQTGDPDRAVIELAGAVEVLEERGALRWQLEAERELRKLGRTIHRRTRPATGLGVASLTGRELELARLVVDRKTNPEIAALLFLSQKTVETHLTNIFRKVGVSSRVELARAVEGAEPSR